MHNAAQMMQIIIWATESFFFLLFMLYYTNQIPLFSFQEEKKQGPQC
jgi:hypothetical protein